MNRFGPDTIISDVLQVDPRAVEVFTRHGLACPSCIAAGMETLSAVASMHEVSVDALLADLNAVGDADEQETR